MDPEMMEDTLREKYGRLREVLRGLRPRAVAVSGGLDSLLLAVIAHRQFPKETVMAHGRSAAVPREAAARLKDYAQREGWSLAEADAGEFEDENYVKNPANRCYFCKKNLYETLKKGILRHDPVLSSPGPGFILSGANCDDLSEYRPGLEAAGESGVRHPFIEAGIGKSDIRGIARMLRLDFWDIAASPCLSSRVYTGTRIESGWLRKVDGLENELRALTGIRVLRCRIRGRKIMIEIPAEERSKLPESLFQDFRARAVARDPGIEDISLDPAPYKPGRAFLVT